MSLKNLLRRVLIGRMLLQGLTHTRKKLIETRMEWGMDLPPRSRS
jgi:hypothetical protein